MNQAIIISVFIALTLVSPGMLQARAPSTNSTGPAQALPEVKTYEELRHAISEARAQSRVRVEKAAEQERVRGAWEIGRLIDAHVLQHKERADYADRTIIRLAKDLDTSETELRYMLQFARAYPIYRTSDELTWSHYESLLALNDPKEREEVAARAAKEKWPVKKLREEVKKRKGAKIKTPVTEEETGLTAKPGKPGAHKILLAKTGPYAGELAVDLGFSNYIRLADVVDDVSPFKEGEVVAFSDEDGEIHKAKEEETYTYRAWVNRVLDGDTVEAVVDLGFGITTTQKLRLKGIDAPEIVTAEGMEAKKALEEMLEVPGGVRSPALRGKKDARAGAGVLIKTARSDKYDRYLVDIWADGSYLNRELVDEGLAVIVEG